MTQEELEILTGDKVRKIIEANKMADPVQFALTHSNNDFPAALVSRQLKSLQKARQKLPSWYQVNGILPERAIEQASSEQTAALKQYQGERLLDLSSGLGVDAYFLSRGFHYCIALEPDPILAQVSQFNFTLLGNPPIEVINMTAEAFLAQYPGPAFDLIYVDPDRRDKQGKRTHDLAATAPDLLALWEQLCRLGKTLLIKASPLYDLHEALRLFPSTKELRVVSLDNECKELLIEVNLLSDVRQSPPQLRIQWIRAGQYGEFVCEYPVHNPESLPALAPPTVLIEPDVAFYKAGIAPHYFATALPELKGAMNHPQGYFFANQILSDFPGRQFEILHHFPYKPKAIRKWLKQKGIQRVNVSKRYFPLATREIRSALAVSEGGEEFLLFTVWNGEKYAFYARRR